MHCICQSLAALPLRYHGAADTLSCCESSALVEIKCSWCFSPFCPECIFSIKPTIFFSKRRIRISMNTALSYVQKRCLTTKQLHKINLTKRPCQRQGQAVCCRVRTKLKQVVHRSPLFALDGTLHANGLPGGLAETRRRGDESPTWPRAAWGVGPGNVS